MSATAIDSAHVRLSWARTPGASAYRIFRGKALVAEVAHASFTDTMLWPMRRYDYRIEAVDASGRPLRSIAAAAATAPLPRSGFQRPFGADSVWNRPIGAARLHPESASLAAYLAANARYPNVTLRNYGVAVAETRPGDPAYSVPCTRFTRCTLGAFGSFGIPLTARPDPSSDGHLTVYDPIRKRAWDMWQAKGAAGSWSAGAGAAISTEGDGIAPARTESGNAANFPLLGGLLRPEEILQGRIDHALVFAMPGVSKLGHVCPATHNDGSSSSPYALREGTRVQLDPSIDVNALAAPAWVKTIARALQVYGMFLRDEGGTLSIFAENPISRGYDAWAAVGLGGTGSAAFLKGIPWDRFRVIDAPASC